MITNRYNKPRDLPGSVRLLPLQGVILLPRSTLPLNVFEPRYLNMVDDALAGDRIIGVIQPHSSAGVSESPLGKSFAIRSIGSFGRITAFSEANDGRCMITLSGIARFEIVEEARSDTPYRIAKVDMARFKTDLEHGRGEEAVDRKRLLKVLRSYLQAHDLSADWDSIERSSSELLINTLSVISPYGPEEKQALLEAPDLEARAKALMALAEMDLATRNDGSGTSVQ